MSEETKVFEILVAEDNPADTELVCTALNEHGVQCTLHVARDGAKAIELLDRIDANPGVPQLDILIVDRHLPKHDGDDILKRLQASERHARTPVILMSGLHSSRFEGTGAKQTTIVHFTKPSELDEYLRLGAIVKDILQKTRGME